MIFYFSGTGNSRHAALSLAGESEQIINITDCFRQAQFEFSIQENELLGFVCPVYFGVLPLIVQEFVRKVRFSGIPAYIYGVFTCGSFSFLCEEMLRSLLSENGLQLSSAWGVRMVPNYVVMYEIVSDEEQTRILKDAEQVLSEIRIQITARNINTIELSDEHRRIAEEMAPIYKEAVKTHKFWIDDTCVGCGTCAARCPVGAIAMRDGYPSWNTSSCQHCMTCIRCGAVEYGITTHGRKRYTHPDLRKKKKHDHTTEACAVHPS